MRVWVDKCLPSLPSRYSVPLGEVAVTTTLRVSTLIDPSSREWDFGFL